MQTAGPDPKPPEGAEWSGLAGIVAQGLRARANRCVVFASANAEGATYKPKLRTRSGTIPWAERKPHQRAGLKGDVVMRCGQNW
jgi:hypothetical protein